MKRSPIIWWTLVALAFGLTPVRVFAQLVQGTVRDTTTGSGVSGARITVSDADGQPVRTVITGVNGSFTLAGPTAGTYLLAIRRVGYRPLIPPPLELGARDTLQALYFLHPLPVELDPVVVEAEAVERFREMRFLEQQGFYKRSRRTDGRFLDPDFIDSRREWTKRADWFLSGSALVIPLPGTHRGFRLRCGRPRLFLDGREYYGDDFDEAVGPDDVLAIEIYDIRFGVTDIFYGRCAVVLWTRSFAGQ